jgi:GTP:adenosylcobinamide-phosphate guanylyltransferase
MKPDRKNTKKILIDLAYKGSSNEFEEFYGYNITYQELEQQSYIEFKNIMFEKINKKIKFRKYGRMGPILTLKADMYDLEIEIFENLINNNKIETIYGWIVKDVTLITSEDDNLEEKSFENEGENEGENEIFTEEEIENINTEEDLY